MNKTELIALRDALHEAKEGSRKLSDGCLLATGWTRDTTFGRIPQWSNPDGTHKYNEYHEVWHTPGRPDLSRSVDDALNCMVPEGWVVNATIQPKIYAMIKIEKGRGANGSFFYGVAHGKDAASLALCKAAIERLIGECDD